MSFHTDVTAAGVWPSDLVTAGVVSEAAAVFTGRRRPRVDRMDEWAWLERLEVEQVGHGLQGVGLHPYRLHLFVRSPSNAGPDGTGDAQIDTVAADLQTLRERYHGTRALYGGVPAIVAVSAEVELVDVDPEDESVIEGNLLVAFAVRR